MKLVCLYFLQYYKIFPEFRARTRKNLQRMTEYDIFVSYIRMYDKEKPDNHVYFESYSHGSFRRFYNHPRICAGV